MERKTRWPSFTSHHKDQSHSPINGSWFLKEMLASIPPNNNMSARPLLTQSSLIPIPCLLSNPSLPSRDAVLSQGLPSISAIRSVPIAASPSLTYTLFCLSLTYFQSWQMKGIKSREGRGSRGRRRGGLRVRELIRLEKHAGLNTLLMSTTKDASSVSGGSWGMFRMIRQEKCSSMCAHLCVCWHVC